MGQFHMILRDNTFVALVLEDAYEVHHRGRKNTVHLPVTAKKMEEINNFQQEPDESLFCAWERFKGRDDRVPQHYLTDMQEVILFYNGLDVPTRQILDSKGAIPSKTAADAKIAIQEIADYSKNGTNWNIFMDQSTKTLTACAI
ncbi:hypothetical protein Tco_0392498 [Tanacetum coccineum]